MKSTQLKSVLLGVDTAEGTWLGNAVKMISLRFFRSRLRVKNRKSNKVFIKGVHRLLNSSVEITGFGNEIRIAGRLQQCALNILGNNNRIITHENSDINWTEITIIANDSEIEIGRDVHFNGKQSAQNLILARGEPSKISIEADCIFSYGVEIRTPDSHKIFDATNNRINPEQNVIIRKHVWVGAKTTILKGVSISEGSIIATGSVVTKSISENVIAAGIPARPIKNHVHWER
ncbi:MAG: acyltransferase [Burkholderiales bacterium]|nr:acyltransferase [Burkholderiales bacterium]